MPFALAFPAGVNTALLVAFAGLGVFAAAATVHERSRGLTAAALVHAVAGVLAVLAADMITLLIAWEVLTFSAFFIIRTPSRRLETAGRLRAERASVWYVAAQICAAALFFVAIVVHGAEAGSVTIAALRPEARWFMFVAILIKTAMMPLHGWLVGGYTQASPTGSIILSVYATKVGVYSAARLLEVSPGSFPVLSYTGAVVAVIAVAHALAQHSARRLLSYHIISQVGYMLVGVGAVSVAQNPDAGAVAGLFHAVNHIIYKALLFMAVAAVMHRVGHDDLRRVGGLWRRMPLAFVCGAIGAAAISGVPFTSGYASKELLKQVADPVPGYLLAVASAGTTLSFIKFIYLIFVRRTRAETDRPTGEGAPAVTKNGPHETPPIRVAMVTLAGLSILIGTVPRIVPGVPAIDYYGPSALLAGVLPLLAGAGIWAVFRGRIISGLGDHAPHTPVRTPARTALLALTGPPLRLLRQAHRLNPQLSVGIAVSAAIVLTFLLVLLA